MTGMGNCYASCHEDFEHTVEMVGDARGLANMGLMLITRSFGIGCLRVSRSRGRY